MKYFIELGQSQQNISGPKMNEADLTAKVGALFIAADLRLKSEYEIRTKMKSNLAQYRASAAQAVQISENGIKGLQTMIKLTKAILKGRTDLKKAGILVDKAQDEWIHAVRKRDTFRIQIDIKRQWAQDRNTMAEAHPKMNSWFQVSFSQAREIAKSFVSFSVWTEYWESKYKFARILKCLTQKQLTRLGLKMTYAAHLYSTTVDKKVQIESIVARLSNMKSLGHHAETFKFVRMVCILFRDIR